MNKILKLLILASSIFWYMQPINCMEKKEAKDYDKMLVEGIKYNELDLVKKAIENKANINYQHKYIGWSNTSEDMTPLHLALHYHDFKEIGFNLIDIIHFLLNHGADVNAKDGNGNTPLHFALAKEGSTYQLFQKTEKILTNSTNNKGLTPLYLATLNHNFIAIKWLLSLPENKNQIYETYTEERLTLLHLAAQGQKEESKDEFAKIAKLYIKLGADPEAQDRDNWRPLHYAVQMRNIELIKFLVEECAVDINALCTKKYYSPGLIAPLNFSCGAETLQYLIEHNANPWIKNFDGKDNILEGEKPGYNRSLKSYCESISSCFYDFLYRPTTFDPQKIRNNNYPKEFFYKQLYFYGSVNDANKLKCYTCINELEENEPELNDSLLQKSNFLSLHHQDKQRLRTSLGLPLSFEEKEEKQLLAASNSNKLAKVYNCNFSFK